jgi:hypothetical protein
VKPTAYLDLESSACKSFVSKLLSKRVVYECASQSSGQTVSEYRQKRMPSCQWIHALFARVLPKVLLKILTMIQQIHRSKRRSCLLFIIEVWVKMREEEDLQQAIAVTWWDAKRKAIAFVQLRHLKGFVSKLPCMIRKGNGCLPPREIPGRAWSAT